MYIAFIKISRYCTVFRGYGYIHNYIHMYIGVQSGRRRTGAHFDRPCFWAHGSGRVCRSRSRSSDMDPGKLPFMSHVLRPALLELQGDVFPGSNPVRRRYVYPLAREEPLFWGMLTGLMVPLSHTKKGFVSFSCVHGAPINTT